MARPAIDKDRIARVLADATVMGDVAAARHHKVSVRTIERYRGKIASDPVLADSVGKRAETLEQDWHTRRGRTLLVLLERLEVLVKTEPDTEKVSRALERLANVSVALAALNVGPATDSESSAPAAYAGGRSEGFEDERRVPVH